MPSPNGPQFAQPLQPQQLTQSATNPFQVKSPRDLEWSMSDNGGMSTSQKWEKGITDQSMKGNQGYLRQPGPTLRNQ